MRWLPARAHDNGLFLLFANGIGPDDNEVRTGNAMILDCYGRILAETDKAGDDMVVADLGEILERAIAGASDGGRPARGVLPERPPRAHGR